MAQRCDLDRHYIFVLLLNQLAHIRNRLKIRAAQLIHNTAVAEYIKCHIFGFWIQLKIFIGCLNHFFVLDRDCDRKRPSHHRVIQIDYRHPHRNRKYKREQLQAQIPSQYFYDVS